MSTVRRGLPRPPTHSPGCHSQVVRPVRQVWQQEGHVVLQGSQLGTRVDGRSVKRASALESTGAGPASTATLPGGRAGLQPRHRRRQPETTNAMGQAHGLAHGALAHGGPSAQRAPVCGVCENVCVSLRSYGTHLWVHVLVCSLYVSHNVCFYVVHVLLGHVTVRVVESVCECVAEGVRTSHTCCTAGDGSCRATARGLVIPCCDHYPSPLPLTSHCKRFRPPS